MHTAQRSEGLLLLGMNSDSGSMIHVQILAFLVLKDHITAKHTHMNIHVKSEQNERLMPHESF